MALSDNVPATNSMLSAVKAILTTMQGILASMQGDTTTVPTVSNAKSGLGAYVDLGSPSVSASNGVNYSNAFVPNGEKGWLRLGQYLTGDRTYAQSTSGGLVWLEADYSGGTTFAPVLGTQQAFVTTPAGSATGTMNFIFPNLPWGASCRFGINFGTIGGTTGVVGLTCRARH